MSIDGGERPTTVLRADLGSDLLRASFALRTEVFVEEQGVPPELELDAEDARSTTRHLVVPAPESDGADGADGADGEPVVLGSVRWIVEPAGFGETDPAWGPIAHLQRLVVARSARGLGLGALLVTAVEDDATTEGFAAVVLAAQLQALGFYERSGYVAHGDVFDDAGIPHRWMTKRLGSA
jgi:predicted GNAT family N-acyltransferase